MPDRAMSAIATDEQGKSRIFDSAVSRAETYIDPGVGLLRGNEFGSSLHANSKLVEAPFQDFFRLVLRQQQHERVFRLQVIEVDLSQKISGFVEDPAVLDRVAATEEFLDVEIGDLKGLDCARLNCDCAGFSGNPELLVDDPAGHLMARELASSDKAGRARANDQDLCVIAHVASPWLIACFRA